jgi:glycosyltransferase involved in cell wall biosynthesis
VKISIIVPVYNEMPSLRAVLERIIRASLPAGCEKEIIVVDDGSTDGTTQLLKTFPVPGIAHIHHSAMNFGKGTAIRVGVSLATGDIVLIQDGDLEYDPEDYQKILDPIVKGESDVVYGSRFLGRPTGMKRANWLANKILTMAANLLYSAHLTDEATAYKAFRRDVLNRIRLFCQRFEFCPEVTAKLRRLGYRIDEVPISYNGRGVAEGKKIKARDGFEALWTLVKYRFISPATIQNPSVPSAPASPALERKER